jgi:MoaA/NifB/PqqE/SkfB family radical SAM enzyme
MYHFFIIKIKDFIEKLIPVNTFLYRYWHFLKMKIKSHKRLKPRKLLRFDVHLADHCNLNCKGCEHFSVIAKDKFLDVDIFKKDCERLSELTNGCIDNIMLMGGEPLLHPQISEVMNIVRRYFPSGIIKIVTNGILLPKQSGDFWQSCIKNDIGISVTKYPIKIDFDKTEKMAKEYNVDLEYYSNTDKKEKTMYRVPIDVNGKQNIKKNFKKCFRANQCIQLQDGKLYTCQTVPYINYFNERFNQNLKVSNKDYIDIYKAKNIDEILVFLSKPIPFCRYCNINKTVFGLQWDISKKDILEWT